jgi:hypothetical protein
MAAGKKYRNAGMPMRNISVLMTANMAGGDSCDATTTGYL